MRVKITRTDGESHAGKVADVKLHFESGVLAGLKLVGFSIWERRGGGRNLTFPAKQYSINGERRSFAFLRPVGGPEALETIRDLVLDAYREFEEQDPESR